MSDQLWYVAQLKAGRERVAIHGLGEQGFQSYYPKMQVTRAQRGRIINAHEPVFPLYLFLKTEPDWQSWRSINNTRGVNRLLGNAEPCPLPSHEVENLMERERAGELRHPHRRQIRVGDRIEFKVGSFVGMTGLCQWTKRERIGVLLKILGGDTVTIAPRDWLKLAAA